MSEEKIIEFFKSPENLSVLKNSKDENEIIEFLSKNGISVSIEKAKALKKLLKSTEEYNRKLSEEELDDIIGGVSIAKVATGIVLGTLAAATIIGGGKFVYDVYDDYQQSKTVKGAAKKSLNILGEELGISKQSPYKKLVSETSQLISDVSYKTHEFSREFFE